MCCNLYCMYHLSEVLNGNFRYNIRLSLRLYHVARLRCRQKLRRFDRSFYTYHKAYHSPSEPVVCFFMAETKLISDAKKQLNEYFAGKRKTFDLPVALSGTDFQMSVWEKLSEIPYGETRTYKQVAEMTGSPASYRAVGSAAGKNPVPIIVPCHRVIASGGSMSGYALGADAKKFLIELEASHR